MTEFTPYASLLGGALIGLAAVVFMAANGRIAGVSDCQFTSAGWRQDRTGCLN